MSLSTPSLRSFSEVFGREALVVARSPGRVNLIGEHVDYQMGRVMPFAVDRYIDCAAAPISEPEIRIWSSSIGGAPLRMALSELRPLDGDDAWANYVLGVIAEYVRSGVEVAGFEAILSGDLPLGAGLSSSAALESVTALVIESLSGCAKSPMERSKLCQAAEHAFAGVPCGLMDQLAVNHGRAGHALMIDCRDLTLTPLPLPAELSFVMVNSGVRHALADGEYARRKADCESAASMLGLTTLREAELSVVDAGRESLGDRLYRRARHVVTENARVERFAEALKNGERAELGRLMAASHASLRDDYEVSCTELDVLVELATDIGAVGTRMTGGGFGGCTINLVPREQAATFCNEICITYQKRQGQAIEAFTVEPVDGAAIL